MLTTLIHNYSSYIADAYNIDSHRNKNMLIIVYVYLIINRRWEVVVKVVGGSSESGEEGMV